MNVDSGEKDILSLADAHARRQAGLVELIGARFERAPEWVEQIGGFGGQIFLRHAEWKSLDLKAPLAGVEGAGDDFPDFVDDGIGHGVAADRAAAAMDH